MAKKNDTMGKTFGVVIALCLVCSIVVSGAAVGLKERQEANAALAMQGNVLQAAGIELDENDNVEDVYAQRIKEYRLNLDSFELSDASEEALAEAADTGSQGETARELSSDDDIAGISELEQRKMFYIAYEEDGETVKSYVLPIRGAGLWGMMYGLLALQDDGQTIAGLNFYQHNETAGLGGEIQNPRWVSNFVGKTAVDEDGNVEIRVTKNANADQNEVDALSGATITSRGVDNTFQFWLSDQVYGPFLAKLREGEL